MTFQKACRILGIDREADQTEIKKKYRTLMRKVHPDSEAFTEGKSLSPYTAQEINEAYEMIIKNVDSLKMENRKQGKAKKERQSWNAPINPNAYMERNILHSVEDSDGEVLGDIVIATDKYFYSEEEEFSLFLKSIFSCSKQLLDEIDEELHREIGKTARLQYQAELTYLLTQQYIDIMGTLRALSKEKVMPDASIFYVPAMLETEYGAGKLSEGSILHPAGVKQHKLMLKTADKKPAGYLSFYDDRFYYILIPLIEQKRVMVKTVVAKEKELNTGKKRKTGKGYQELDFWVKISGQQTATFPESINIKIDDILNRYKNFTDIS